MNYIPTGTVISVGFGPYEHVGIVTDRTIGDTQTVISNSARKGGVFEESISLFSRGRKINLKGYIGDLDPYSVLSRARSKIGTKYNVLKWNCEHFIRWVHGLKPESPQLKLTIVIAMLALCGWLVIKARK